MTNLQKNPDQGITNVIFRDSQSKAKTDQRREVSIPISPIDATDWGFRRILSLPVSPGGWVDFLCRGSGYGIVVLKILETAIFRYQLAVGVGGLITGITWIVLWKFNPKYRGHLAGKLSPYIILATLILGGGWAEIEENRRVNDSPETPKVVLESEGVG